jgi:hypothetical protein
VQDEGARAEDYRPEMPSTGAAGYLLEFLYEIGPTMAGPMGAGPITFAEIDAWCRLGGVDLKAWEARMMRRLSCEYLSQSAKAEKRDCPEPWTPKGARPAPTAAQLALRAIARENA